ncbi:hypothetical protein TthAA37_23650 (plasmid) [Thermus thermophilus]|nr:hypothetical protein TthAA37_23650 [Thermus thermophilus]
MAAMRKFPPSFTAWAWWGRSPTTWTSWPKAERIGLASSTSLASPATTMRSAREAAASGLPKTGAAR